MTASVEPWGAFSCNNCKRRHVKRSAADRSCERCELMLRLIWGDERTDRMTGSAIRQFVHTELERTRHNKTMQDFLEGRIIERVNIEGNNMVIYAAHED